MPAGSKNVPHRPIFSGNGKETPPSLSPSGTDESRQPSPGENGGATRSTSDPTSLVTVFSLGKYEHHRCFLQGDLIWVISPHL